MLNFPVQESSLPLEVDEVINFLRRKWEVSYDLRLVVRDKSLFLQVMWSYLEQQSFPLDEKNYRLHLHEVVEVINRIGVAGLVREWLLITRSKPMVGKPLSLRLISDWRLKEFVL